MSINYQIQRSKRKSPSYTSSDMHGDQSTYYKEQEIKSPSQIPDDRMESINQQTLSQVTEQEETTEQIWQQLEFAACIQGWNSCVKHMIHYPLANMRKIPVIVVTDPKRCNEARLRWLLFLHNIKISNLKYLDVKNIHHNIFLMINWAKWVKIDPIICLELKWHNTGYFICSQIIHQS